MKTEFVIIHENLKSENKLIRFSHQSQDLTKVCTYVHIFYDGNFIENKLFFLEQQGIINNVLDIVIPTKTRSVKVEVKTPSELYDLENLNVEIIYRNDFS